MPRLLVAYCVTGLVVLALAGLLFAVYLVMWLNRGALP